MKQPRRYRARASTNPSELSPAPPNIETEAGNGVMDEDVILVVNQDATSLNLELR